VYPQIGSVNDLSLDTNIDDLLDFFKMFQVTVFIYISKHEKINNLENEKAGLLIWIR
jgi:hypothetical protein